MPAVFLIGDSISIQYGPYLTQYTDGVIRLSRKEDDGKALKNLDVPTGANGGDSRMVLEYLKSKLGDTAFRPDYILLNCGLHDIKRDPVSRKIQVTETGYRSNLSAIMSLLKEKGIKPIWIRTTAVVDTIHNSRSGAFKRYAEDLARYNAIADQVCRENNIPAIDLYGFTFRLGIAQFTDHVHYKEEARALQAAYIAGQLTQLIKE
ncbi:MAG: hypothetical protein ABS46_03885 [Cytophagaceae bacterium SCN 52-12]|nr:MAG: hypothetical protein ABS46_03885 [Cytophagaceae bacterium SCN 52-12]